MKKYKLLFVAIFLFAITLAAIAIDSDYKNNLLKIDVTKVTDNNYRITLFTQNPYSEPFKIVKKSDTEYYLLLPETYHSITSAPTSPDENIKNIQVKLFPYLGQDLNNGYTRVNIQTAKPLNFTTAVRTAQAATVARTAQTQLDKIIENKSQTHPIFEDSSSFPVTEAPKTTVAQAPKVTTKTPKITQPKQPQISEPQPQKSTVAQKPAYTEPKPKVIDVPQETPKEIIVKSSAPESKSEPVISEPKTPITGKSQIQDIPTSETSTKTVDEILKEELPTLEEAASDESVAPFLPDTEEGETLELPAELETETSLESEIANKFNISPVKAINIAIVILVLWLLSVIFKSKKKRVRQVKISQRSEISDNYIEKTEDEPPTISTPPYVSVYTQPTEQFEETSAAQEFEADLDEYEQKIVEAQIQLEPAKQTSEEALPSQTEEFEIVEPAQAESLSGIETVGTPEIEPREEQIYTPEPDPSEPAVMASAQIEPGKWLYLLDFEGSIALVGVVNDSFSIIKQFKTIENKEIQYRLSEQRESANYYIVKLDTFKALVKVGFDDISLKIEL